MAKPALFQAPANPVASLTCHDMMAVLRCSRQTIKRKVDAGELPAPVRVGRRLLWPSEAVAKLLLGTNGKGAA